MDKTFTRTGRRSKYGGVRSSGSEDSKGPISELVNGGSEKEENHDIIGEKSPQESPKDEAMAEINNIKEETFSDDERTTTAEGSEFHGFDESSAPSGVSVLNKLVGKYEADLKDRNPALPKENKDVADDAHVGHKVLGEDIYTDSEDESSKPRKGIREVKVAPKKRPLEKLAEELDDDEKRASPPPAKRARKKSAKAREAAGDSAAANRPPSDPSEVTSSADVPRKNKAIKEEPHSEVTSSGGTPTSKKQSESLSATRGGRNVTRNIQDPIYLKPLEMGWKRELVYRGTDPKGGVDGAKRTGDIYYYTPQGKKVRSRVEILEHLKGSGLNVNHFCFLKEPLGIDDPTKEVIREAKLSRKSLGESSPVVKKEKSPKVPKQKALKGANSTESPTVSNDVANTPGGGSNGTSTSPSNTPSGAKAVTPRVVLKNKPGPKPGTKLKLMASRKSNTESPPAKPKGRPKKENSQAKESDLDTGALSSWDSKDQHVSEANPPNSASALWKSKSSKLKAASTSSRVRLDQCSIRCVGALGAVPALQCHTCLCLYHPMCVGLGSNSETYAGYICKNCVLGPKEKTTSASSAGSALAPHQPSIYRALSGSPKSPPCPPAPPIAGPTKSEQPAPPQTVATIGGQKFIVVPKHNILAVSSESARGITRAASPTLGSHPSASHGAYLVPGTGMVSNNPGHWHGLSSDYVVSKRAKTSDNADTTIESTTAGPQGKINAKRDMENFISDLSNGYGALFHVMGYLKVQELLRASRVCRMWRDLSLHPNLWHTVRMKNSQVSDWDGFAAALSARGTRVLDLRKMLAPGRAEDIEHMWSEFCRVIKKADSLQRVELSRCPASVVEQLATSCPQLRVINAIAIKSEEVDLEPIREVPLLEELRLKSNNGMNITRTLDPLLFCRLKHLSLTSVKNLGSCNVEVLSQLQNLESLELGDCVKLSNSFGPDHLAKLTKLQRLRLEKGQVPGCPVISIIESIAKLPALRQLEIINFDVKPGFDKALAMCKQVRRLLIIPTYISTSASTNHIVLCSIPLLADSLEYLVWGLTTELARVTDLFIDQCEARKGAQGPSKLNAFPGECIPIIKPVVGQKKDKDKKENGKGTEDATEDEKMEVDGEIQDKGEKKEDEKSQKEKDEASGSDTDDDVESLAYGFQMLSASGQTEEGPSGSTPPVSILPIPKLHKLLNQLLPDTRVKILKVPFLSTWRQTFPELSTF